MMNEQPTSSTTHAVERLRSSAAEGLWAAMRADGFLVDVRESGNGVIVEVTAGEGSCADCLVPAHVIATIVRTFLEDEGIPASDLPIDVRLPADHS